MGGPTGVLGAVVTPERGTPDNIGRFSIYQGGGIWQNPTIGVREVQGAIHGKYQSLNTIAGILGYPLTDETGTPDGIGRFNHFQKGSIYWTPATGAHEVHGGIGGAWASMGWERSQLGYPVSDEYTSAPGFRRVDFQHGSITWNMATGQWTVS
jgi:uncharacterized protein with LGFP repeats